MYVVAPEATPSVAIKFALVIVKFAGFVPGFVTTGIMSTEFKVVVDGKADIFVSPKASEGTRHKNANSFFISLLRKYLRPVFQ